MELSLLSSKGCASYCLSLSLNLGTSRDFWALISPFLEWECYCFFFFFYIFQHIYPFDIRWNWGSESTFYLSRFTHFKLLISLVFEGYYIPTNQIISIYMSFFVTKARFNYIQVFMSKGREKLSTFYTSFPFSAVSVKLSKILGYSK